MNIPNLLFLIILTACGKINMDSGIDKQFPDEVGNGKTVISDFNSRKFNNINKKLNTQRYDDSTQHPSGYTLDSRIENPELFKNKEKTLVVSMDDINHKLFVVYNSLDSKYSILDEIDMSNLKEPSLNDSFFTNEFLYKKVFAYPSSLIIVAKRFADNRIVVIEKKYSEQEMKLKAILAESVYNDAFIRKDELSIATPNNIIKYKIGSNYSEISNTPRVNVHKIIESLKYQFMVSNESGYYVYDKTSNVEDFILGYDKASISMVKQNAVTYINNGKDLTLSIVDNIPVIDNASPIEISKVNLFGESHDIKFHQQKLILAQGTEGFNLIDVENVEAPNYHGKILLDFNIEDSHISHPMKSVNALVLADKINGVMFLSNNKINTVSPKIKIHAKSHSISTGKADLIIRVNGDIIEKKTIANSAYLDYESTFSRDILESDTVEVILSPSTALGGEQSFVQYVKINDRFCYQKEKTIYDDIGLLKNLQAIVVSSDSCEVTIVPPVCISNMPKVPTESCTPNEANKNGELFCDETSLDYECRATTCADGYYLGGMNICLPQICAPSSNESCSIDNGQGQRTCNAEGSSWGSCLPTNCDVGFHTENGQCLSDIKQCSIPNGTGTSVWEGSDYGACTVDSCNSGFYQDGNSCEVQVCSPSSFRACTIANGSGTEVCNANGSGFDSCNLVSCDAGFYESNGMCLPQICVPSTSLSCPVQSGLGSQLCNADGSALGECNITSCNTGYHLEDNSCQSNIKSCTLPNGTGSQTWNGTSYDVCTPISCNVGFHIENGQCMSDVKSCTLSNGIGSQTWDSTQYGSCIASECDTGYHVEVGICVEDTRSCTISNGTGSQTWLLNSWGTCSPVSCNSGFHIENNSCETDVKSCAMPNGTGSQTWNGTSYDVCTPISCNAGYHIENGQCMPDIKICLIANGTATQTWNGSSYGACTLSSCNSGYFQDGNACIQQACTPDEIQSCSITNGTGSHQCNNQGSGFGVCTLVSCDTGFHVDGGICSSDTRTCSLANGSGTQTWNGSSYGTCIPTTCDTGYHIEAGLCLQDTKSCPVENGTGTQTWNGSSYGTCNISSCNGGFHEENGTCISDTRSCSIDNGTGTQTWNGSSYGTCIPTTCDTGYHIEAGLCLSNTRSCSIDNGTGSQIWNGSSYSACVLTSCDSGYSEVNGACYLQICVPSEIRSCPIDNGVGSQTCDVAGLNLSSCEAVSCDSGYHIDSGICHLNVCNPSETISCTINGFEGTRTCNAEGSQNGDCIAGTTCSEGYYLDGGICHAQVCTPNTSSVCDLGNGFEGTRTCNAEGSSFGVCNAPTCDEGQVMVNGSCVTDNNYCQITNGVGQLNQIDDGKFGIEHGITSDTGLGYSYYVKLNNKSSNYINNWSICFTYNHNINGGVFSAIGDTDYGNPNHRIYSNVGITAGGSTTFSFIGYPGNLGGDRISNIKIYNSKDAECSDVPNYSSVISCDFVSCNLGYHRDGDSCVSNTRSCVISNGTGTQTWNGSSWGTCAPASCNTGYHVENGSCFSNTKACATSNGTGTQTWNGSDYGTCAEEICNTGYHLEFGVCINDIRACVMTNGTGTQTWNESSYGTCTPVSCNSGYHIESGNCLNDTKLCPVDNGIGTQTWNGSSYGACNIQTCNTGYHVESGSCVFDVKSCIITNGTGSQTWNGSSYGACTPVNCLENFHVEGGACVANVRSCLVDNGTGTQTWNGSSYGACTIQTCNTGYHVENGMCLSDVKSCTVVNGVGTQSWNGSSYGACTIQSCNAGYHAESGSCLSNIKACSITNGTGTQMWNGSSYGACTPASCNTGYHVDGNLCVSDTRSCTVANGTGTQTWNGSSWGECSNIVCNSNAILDFNTNSCKKCSIIELLGICL